jgi:hypothetical protein
VRLSAAVERSSGLEHARRNGLPRVFVN